MKALSLIVAPRMPAPPTAHPGNPFESLSDVVIDCGEEGCGWHAMGPRQEVKKAWDEHYRLYHSQQIGMVRINHPSHA